MAAKVKTTNSTMKAGLIKVPHPAWQMDSFSCNVYASNDPKSEKGIKINIAMMDYEKKCSQAKIDLIDEIKIIIKSPITNKSKKNPKTKLLK